MSARRSAPATAPASAVKNRPTGQIRQTGQSFRFAVIMAAIVFFTSLGVFGLSWWQDRPLRQIAALLDDGDYSQTQLLADRFLAQHPHDSRALLFKARALSGIGAHSRADSVFQQVAMQSNGFPDDIPALRAWSVTLLHLEQWSRAVAVMETLLKSFPNDAEILYSLTIARIRLSQYDTALESARRLEAISGHEQQAAVIIGTIHHDQGNRRAALETWESVLKVNPEAEGLQISDGEFMAMVGEELLECGFPERAVRMLEDSVARTPQARACALLGQALSQSNRPDDAVRAWQQALQYEPMNSLAREELANVAIRRGEPQKAVDLLLPLTRADTVNSSLAYILQRAYTVLKQDEKAELWRQRTNELREQEKTGSTITELLRNSKDPFWSGFLRAYQLAHGQNWEASERIVNDLLIQRPDDPLLRSLAAAVRQRGELPPVDLLTNRQY